jgi:hypothetical protein
VLLEIVVIILSKRYVSKMAFKCLFLLAAACLVGSASAGAGSARRSMLGDALCSKAVLEANPGEPWLR